MTPVLFFFTDYCGESLYGGKAETRDEHLKKLYQSGVQFGALLLAGLNVVVLPYSLALPFFQRYFSIKQLYAFSHVCALAFVLALVTTKAAAIGVVLVASVLSATFNTVPFALLKAYTDDSSAANLSNGYFVGLMNIAQVTGQMLANLIYGGVASKSPPGGIALGAAFALVGLPLILWLPTPIKKVEIE